MTSDTRCTFPHMSPFNSSAESPPVVKLTSTAKKLQSTRLSVIRKVDDLESFQEDAMSGKSGKAQLAEKMNESFRLEVAKDSKPPMSVRLSSHSRTAVDRVMDKRVKFERPNEFITPRSLSATAIAERKLDLTDDDVAFLISYNQLLRKSVDNDSSVLFTDEDFIKTFYKWDVESIKASIARGSVKTQRIDSSSALSFLKAAGVKKDIPDALFPPLYDYYCLRWDGHQNLPVCRCSWVIIQQLNEYKNLVSSAKLA